LSLPLGADLCLDLDLPLLAMPAWFGNRGLQRWLRLRGGAGGGLWALATDMRGDGVPVVQLEMVMIPGDAVALGLRAEPSSGTFGVTAAFRWDSWAVRTSHLLHPELGPTHRWSFLAGSLAAVW
jgi:hypothetical protein